MTEMPMTELPKSELPMTEVPKSELPAPVQERPSLTHRMSFAVRPAELDSFGHVNNARYLEYLEWARAEWGNVRGVRYERFHAWGVIPAVVEARLRFLKESALGDTLTIQTTPEVKHRARIVFHQEITNQDGRRVLKAEVHLVAVDMQARTFTEFPPELIAMLGVGKA